MQSLVYQALLQESNFGLVFVGKSSSGTSFVIREKRIERYKRMVLSTHFLESLLNLLVSFSLNKPIQRFGGFTFLLWYLLSKIWISTSFGFTENFLFVWKHTVFLIKWYRWTCISKISPWATPLVLHGGYSHFLIPPSVAKKF